MMAELAREIMIDATPETIWPYLTEPDKHVDWCGTVAELDPRPGGIYRVFMAGQFSAIRWLILLVIIIGVVFVNMENLYGTFLTSLASLSPSGTFASGKTLRLIFTTVAGAVGTLFAILASAHLIVDLENFLLFLPIFPDVNSLLGI